MSIQAIAWVLDHSEAKGGDLLALISIANHADKFGKNSFPSYQTIAQESRLSRRQAIRCIRNLEEIGELKIERWRGAPGLEGVTNLYTMVKYAALTGDNMSLALNPQTESSDMASDTGVTGVVTPMSPKPSYNQEPLSTTRQVKLGAGITTTVPDGIDLMVVLAFVEHRNRMKAPLTEKALELCLNEASKAVNQGTCKTPEDAIEQTILAGWKGINASWLKNRNRTQAPPPTGQGAQTRPMPEYLRNDNKGAPMPPEVRAQLQKVGGRRLPYNKGARGGDV